MNEVKAQRSRNSAILWASMILFDLFAVQTVSQLYQVHRNHLEVDTDLSAELADADFLDEEPAPENDYLLVLGEEGLLLLDAAAEKHSPKAQARPFHGGRCWTMPVVAEGKLFLRDEQQIKCFDHLNTRH